MTEMNLRSEPLAARNLATSIVTERHPDSAVSWAAIFAGAAGAAALSLLLMIIGTGLGFSAMSPWRMEGISATTFGMAAIAWLSFTQLAASGVGGYLAGRLRTRWTAVHTDEVYFRDTAHGFLSWAIASLLTAVVLTSVLTSVLSAVGGGMRSGATVVSAAAGTIAGAAVGSAASESGTGDNNNALGYFVDSLFRADSGIRADSGFQADNQPKDDSGNPAASALAQSNVPAPVDQTDGATPQVNQPMPTVGTAASQANQANQADADMGPIPTGEVTRIYARALLAGALPQEDERYIGQLIAQRTQISQTEAEQRVSTSFEEARTMLKAAETKAREVTDEARKASAYTALWMSVALLLGAFFASVMAIFGGRQRDA